MSTTQAILIFVGSLVLSAMASAVLAERLDQVGARLRLPAGLVGLVTALGADSPEIASAVAALVGGQHDLGRGVIFGSNVFNVAMLLGLTALVAGPVAMGSATVVLNGGVALLASLIVGAQASGLLGTWATGAGLALVLLPYFAVASLRPERVASLPLPEAARSWLRSALTAERRDERAQDRDEAARGDGGLSWADRLSILPMLSVVVATSIALVRTAEILGQRWGVSQVVIGTFVVATLTGLPNLIAALRLARRGRGAALASEAFNSNTLNLLVGAFLPSLFVALSPPSRDGTVSALALVLITVAALAIGAIGRGFGRRGGAALLVGYAAYAASLLW